jgi:hypothetical protein
MGIPPPTKLRTRPAMPWEFNGSKFRKMLDRRRWPESKNWWSHQHASSVRRKVGRSTWENSFKFTVVRNPWDRAISAYFWRNSRNQSPVSMDEVVRRSGENWSIYSIRNILAVDFVIGYELLLEDFREVCDRIGVDHPTELPRLKSEHRNRTIDPRELLTSRQVAEIARRCRREIEMFGYEYNSSSLTS